ncbi:MAG TPA: hypothetical protein VJA40_05985 [archaeon]|nr:hypothetical protein [archaeon]
MGWIRSRLNALKARWQKRREAKPKTQSYSSQKELEEALARQARESASKTASPQEARKAEIDEAKREWVRLESLFGRQGLTPGENVKRLGLRKLLEREGLKPRVERPEKGPVRIIFGDKKQKKP